MGDYSGPATVLLTVPDLVEACEAFLACYNVGADAFELEPLRGAYQKALAAVKRVKEEHRLQKNMGTEEP